MGPPGSVQRNLKGASLFQTPFRPEADLNSGNACNGRSRSLPHRVQNLVRADVQMTSSVATLLRAAEAMQAGGKDSEMRTQRLELLHRLTRPFQMRRCLAEAEFQHALYAGPVADSDATPEVSHFFKYETERACTHKRSVSTKVVHTPKNCKKILNLKRIQDACPCSYTGRRVKDGPQHLAGFTRQDRRSGDRRAHEGVRH